MKVKVKAPFFDDRGIHKVGEIVEVKELNPLYHEPVAEEKKAKIETAIAKEPKKTTRKKA